MMAALLNVFSILALLIGLAFNTLGVIGILRFPDFYTRLHADTKATTFGSIFTSIAVMCWSLKLLLASGDTQFLNHIAHTILAVVLLMVTNATGSHALARAAHRMGVRPNPSVRDDLQPEEENTGAPSV